MKQNYSVCIYLDSSSRTSNPCISKNLNTDVYDEALTNIGILVDFYRRFSETGYIVLYDSYGECFTLYF